MNKEWRNMLIFLAIFTSIALIIIFPYTNIIEEQETEMDYTEEIILETLNNCLEQEIINVENGYTNLKDMPYNIKKKFKEKLNLSEKDYLKLNEEYILEEYFMEMDLEIQDILDSEPIQSPTTNYASNIPQPEFEYRELPPVPKISDYVSELPPSPEINIPEMPYNPRTDNPRFNNPRSAVPEMPSLPNF